MINFTILRFDSIGSTNTEALKQARLGADEGLCVIAQQQTAGRGRQGRQWISPKNAGLYLSIVLLPTLDPTTLPLITLTTAIAVFDTLTGFGLAADIKWPNDLLVNEKKICGILAETTETERGMAVVIGIGINLASESFPDDLNVTATSLADEMGDCDARTVESSLLYHFERCYETLEKPDGPSQILGLWQMRSSYFSGKPVRVTLPNETFVGVTDGLDLTGALRVLRSDGNITIVQAGDVERLREAIKE